MEQQRVCMPLPARRLSGLTMGVSSHSFVLVAGRNLEKITFVRKLKLKGGSTKAV